MSQSRVTATVRTKEVPCATCGKPIKVGSNKRNPIRHFECSLSEAIACQQQLREHSGPYYDKWLAGIAAFVRRTQGGARTP